MTEFFSGMTDAVLAVAETPWVLVAVYVLTVIDGFFPPVPSESVVIGVAALTMAGEGPSLWLLVLVAALGAFSGDLVAYHIGRWLPVRSMRLFRGKRGQAALHWAEHALERRATILIMSARFVPVGRVAVNMTAGAVRFPRARFTLIAAFSAVVWGSLSTSLGIAAGAFLHEHPLLAVALGVVVGVLFGMLVDWIIARINVYLERRAVEKGLRTRAAEALLRSTAPADLHHDDEAPPGSQP